MTMRSELCYRLSLPALDRPVETAKADIGDYQRWRRDSLRASWSRFGNRLVDGKRVLDFGCGDGHLSLFLANESAPASITGVDIDELALARAGQNLAAAPPAAPCRFVTGSRNGLPFDDASFDTIVAFDCLEHVMSPLAILTEWSRVLDTGGRVAIEWFPFRGPWGPHMESLIPLPWAHLLFGERAMFAAAARLYDHPRFQPRHWDIGEDGHKRPNKWRQWSTFREQAYVNELTVAGFKRLAAVAGFAIERLDRSGIGGADGKLAPLGKAAARLPWIGEWLTSYCLIELRKVRSI